MENGMKVIKLRLTWYFMLNPSGIDLLGPLFRFAETLIK